MINRLKKTNDIFGVVLHAVLSLMLPIALFILIQQFRLYSVAALLIILSKWRVFMVKPRFWLDNIKANGVDFVFGFSILAIMYLIGRGNILESSSITDKVIYLRLGMAIFYAFWLIVIKHLSSTVGVAIQAYISVAAGMVASFWFLAFTPQLVVAIAVILTISAASYHIRLSYQDAPEGSSLSLMWLLFTAYALTFLFGYAGSYAIADSFVITSSGAILTVSFIGFEVAYLLLKNSGSKLMPVVCCVVTLLINVLIVAGLKLSI